MKIEQTNALCINAPQFFADPDFIDWLNNDETKFTWHNKGAQPNDYSDVVVLVDPSLNGEGTDSDMPEYIWTHIVEVCKVQFGALPRGENHIMVRITNLEE